MHNRLWWFCLGALTRNVVDASVYPRRRRRPIERLSPIPSCIVAISFYGIAEVARSIEDPFSWVEPCHDLTGKATLDYLACTFFCCHSHYRFLERYLLLPQRPINGKCAEPCLLNPKVRRKK